MPFKITPEELNPHRPPSELSLSLQRNERLVKNAQRQLEYDGRIKPHRGDHTDTRKQERRSLEKRNRASQEKKADNRDMQREERKNDVNKDMRREERKDERRNMRREEKKEDRGDMRKEENKDDRREVRREERRDLRRDEKKDVVKDENVRKDEKKVDAPKPSDSAVKLNTSIEEFAVTRLDAVVFVVILAQIVGCLAVGFEIYAYSLDQEWNGIIRGENPINELADHTVFKEKTFKLEGHVYLQKTVEYVTRNEPEELVFIIIILLFVVVSFLHICACYIKASDVEQYTALLIGLYAIGGAICMFSSTFLITASVNIENGFTYAADMLHNFRLINTDEPLTSQDQDKCHKEYKNGCDYYEFAKLQSLYLERIFRQCGSGSRFTRYYMSDNSKTSVEVFDETYFRSELKEIGFCSRDGYKFAAAVCAIIMGMLCAIVPVIFCCQGRADRKRDAFTEADSSGIQKSTDLQDEGKSGFDQTAFLEQFRAYVEKDSGMEEEQNTLPK